MALILRDDQISYAGYRFPPVIIQQATWLYARFTLSFRDVEDLLVERGIAVSYGFLPENLVTDDLLSYHDAARDLGIERRHCTGR